MSVIGTIGIYAAIPVGLYLLIASLTLIPGREKKHPRYRPGQQWDFAPQLWTGQQPVVTGEFAVPAGPEGGARGNW